MFFRKKESHKKVLVDQNGKMPVIRASICTGEKVAGFKDPKTGKFEDVMLIRTSDDMDTFLNDYHLKEDDVKTIY